MIRLEIAAPCDPLTANQRLHHHKRAELTRNWRLRTAILARKCQPIPHAHVTYWLHATTNRRRDVGNYYPTVKACLDGVVDAGVLDDDSDAYVVGPDPRAGEKSPGGLWIELVLDPDCACSGLDTVLFVNSGSEANDTAWRLATVWTGARGGLASAFAYHGVTQAIADVSPEEWVGDERPAHVEAFDPLDRYRDDTVPETAAEDLLRAAERRR